MSQLAPPVEIYWISGSPMAWRVLLTAEVKGIPYEEKLLQASKGELKAPDFLAPGGLLIFPVLTLSREQLVTERARSRFAAVELVEEQWYPVNEQLLEHLPLLEQMATAGNVRVEKRGSRWCWATRIYVAHRD